MAGFFFRQGVEPPLEDLVLEGLEPRPSAEALRAAASRLAAASEWTAAALEAPARSLAEERSLKPAQLFGALRVAVTGQRVSPPLFETMEIVGREVCLERIETAARRLGGD
jgi:glutamyl-tRNA synthetase